MSSTLNTKTEQVLSDEKFLKELETRIGIRLIIFKDKYNRPRCNVFLFGFTDSTRTNFYWLETGISVVSLGKIKFEVWRKDIAGNFRTTLLSWEERHAYLYPLSNKNGLTWWDKLVTNELFTCISVFSPDVVFEKISFISPDDNRLQIFYGLLSANIANYAHDIAIAAHKHSSIRDIAEALGVVSKRLNGFVSENYFDGFGIPDDV